MQPETEAGLAQTKLDAPFEALVDNSCAEAGGGGMAAVEVVRGSASLYNLVKALSKEADSDAAIEKLRLAATADAARLNAKNSKGSTALHACGYLRRWDMAQALLDAGADPVTRNAAGHSFFLTAVRDPEAPWEILFGGHPELLDKHRKFLAKEPRRHGAKERIGPQAGQLIAGRPPGDELAEAPRRPSPQLEICEAFEMGDWDRFVSGGAAPGLDASEGARECLARFGPIAAVELAFARGLALDAIRAETLCRRAVAEAWSLSGRSWVMAGRHLSATAQRGVLSAAVQEARFSTVEALARAGWAYDEELVEELEELGAYEVADALIDLQSAPPAPIGRPEGGKPARGAGPSRPAAGKVGIGKRARKVAPGKARGRPKKERKSSSMIANLDRPSKEASDFEYRERQPQAKAPLIIVKKARAPAIQPKE